MDVFIHFEEPIVIGCLGRVEAFTADIVNVTGEEGTRGGFGADVGGLKRGVDLREGDRFVEDMFVAVRDLNSDVLRTFLLLFCICGDRQTDLCVVIYLPFSSAYISTFKNI